MTYQAPEPVEAAAAASHPSVDQLADLHEELLAPAEAATVRAHLADCQECSDTLTALGELTDLLGADEPPAMPVDVALRLDAALAAEAARTPEAAATAGPQPRPGGRAAPAAPPTRTDRHSRPGRSTFRRRARLLLATAGCLAVLGLGAALLDSGTSGIPTESAAGRNTAASTGPMSAGAARSGTLYSADQLPSQVRQLLADQSAGPGKSVPHATSQTQDATPTTQLPDCVRSAVGSHAGASPVAIGHGSYGGTPVDVYVFPIAADPSHLDVYLLDAGCALHTPAAPATVELHQTVAAP